MEYDIREAFVSSCPDDDDVTVETLDDIKYKFYTVLVSDENQIFFEAIQIVVCILNFKHNVCHTHKIWHTLTNFRKGI